MNIYFNAEGDVPIPVDTMVRNLRSDGEMQHTAVYNTA